MSIETVIYIRKRSVSLKFCYVSYIPLGSSNFDIDVNDFESGLHTLNINISTELGQEFAVEPIVFGFIRKYIAAVMVALHILCLFSTYTLTS